MQSAVNSAHYAPGQVADVTPRSWAQQARPTTLTKLGDRIDGWADTFVGDGAHVDQVAQSFYQELLPHLKPTMKPKYGNIGVGGLSSLATGVYNPVAPQQILPTLGKAIGAIPHIPAVISGRSPANRQYAYQFVTIDPGVSMIVKISTIGYDLFVGWDIFVKRVWNEVVIGWVLLTTLILWAITGFVTLSAASTASSLTSGYPYTTPASVPTSALSLFSGCAFIFSFFYIFLGVMAFVACLSFLFRRSFSAFFFKDMDLFEGHDVAGMMLSVHKAMIRSVVAAGIDTSKLRQKEEFKRDRGNVNF